MKVIGLIPARHASTRYPGKPLVELAGRPMVTYVAEILARCVGLENTYVATESEKIKEVVEAHGYKVIMTTDKPLTGTDRLWEAAQQVGADIYLNVQGDEPLLDPSDIQRVIDKKKEIGRGVVNAYCPVGADEDPASVNLPKVIVNERGQLVYMSRAALPASKSPAKRPKTFLKQVCIYAFTYDELKAFGTFGRKSYLEEFEDIEILRFLELGIPVEMVEARHPSLALDVPEDREKVERQILKARGHV